MGGQISKMMRSQRKGQKDDEAGVKKASCAGKKVSLFELAEIDKQFGNSFKMTLR